MKYLFSIVLTIGLLTAIGCDDKSSTAPDEPSAQTHSENDGHDHTSEKSHTEAGDHSGHDH